MQDEHSLLTALLKRKPAGAFEPQELSGKAHWRWNRNQYVEAAVLFDAAWRVATDKGDRAAFCFRVRSGICFRLAGHLERAWPILQEAVQFDWDAAGLESDSHMSDWAFVQMLAAHHEHRDIESFVAVFSQAVRRGEQLSAPFTRIHPHQDSLLSWCADLELKEEFCHIAEAALYYRGNSQRLRNNIQQLQQRLALSVLKSSD